MGFNATGDGIASALLVLEALDGKPLSDRTGMEKLPQRLVNVRIASESRSRRSRASSGRSSANPRASRAGAACWCAPAAPSR
jgi:phosphoglucosamine mutase